MLEPFLKWAGGKRWLISQYGDLFPREFNRYIEPFLGGGAVYFHLKPEDAILADSNADLINAYQMIAENPGRLQSLLVEYHEQHCEDFYYRMRAKRLRSPLSKAARFIYLNRVCFNGLYRVNQRGDFNVPIGSKTVVRFPPGFLHEVSQSLQPACFLVSDFEAVLNEAEEDDFVYVDPPYTVMHNNNNFVKYNDVLFSWEDQVRLSVAVAAASERGALVFVSNADHPSVRELYEGFGFHHTLVRSSILAGRSAARRRTSEIAILNYEV